MRLHRGRGLELMNTAASRRVCLHCVYGISSYDQSDMFAVSRQLHARVVPCLIAAAGIFSTDRCAWAAAPPKAAAGFLADHCYDCHDGDIQKGGLNLADLEFQPDDADNFAVWQRALERARDGEMPPSRKPRPEAVELKRFLSVIEPRLLKADRAHVETRGRVKTRRLTRTEYEHTLHDMLSIDVPLKSLLPEDPASHGFETVADGQQLSHHQLARYLDVADLALGEAFRRAGKEERPHRKFCTPGDLARRRGGNYRGPDLRDGRSISWPMSLQFFGRMYETRVPMEGWYRITLKDVQAVNPGKDGAVWGTLRSGACSSSAPILYMIGLVEATTTPRDLVFEAWIRKDHMLELKPNDFELRRPRSGAKGANVSFRGRDLESEGYSGIANKGILIERIHPYADRKQVRKNLFGDATPESAKADPRGTLNKLVARFARRAFRRPLEPEVLKPYQQIGRQSLADGDSFSVALQSSYRAILCSPRFLTLVEKPGRLDDHALASRLSYALWVSMPDWRLTRLANEKKLREPAVLRGEIDRMLKHPKAERFVTSFTDQWLKLNEIDFTSPDRRRFKTFDPVVQESMVRETRSFFSELIESDMGIGNFVDSKIGFFNGRLARHYGIDVSLKPGEGIQKASLARLKDNIRGGFVTQGSILKVTADGSATSPVVRGVFVNERILGVKIPPPPPGVPAIEPDIRGAKSIRDQLDKHRDNESCRSCHRTIDPPGLALESFDPVGRWRDRYGSGRGVKVDPAGVTEDGVKFAGIVDWKRIHSEREDQLARGFVGHFLTYATGAPPRFSDHAIIDEIVKRTGEKGHGVRAIVHACLQSSIFQSK